MSAGIESELMTLTKVFMETGNMLQDELLKLNATLRTIASDIDNAEFEIQGINESLCRIADALEAANKDGGKDVL